MTTRAIPSDAWERGDPYEAYVGRWSRRVAPLFLSWLAEPPARRWLDVGCGTGALLGAIVDRIAPAAATGVDPSTGFLETCARRVAGRAELHHGGAERIPLPVGTVDYAVSGLVLNFLPDPSAAPQEMARVTIVGARRGSPNGAIAMRHKLAVILYSLLLLAFGYIVGRSTATTAAPMSAAPMELQSRNTLEVKPGSDEATTTTELTDWPDLTP
jgi:SAM-dependent methyltransferase